MGSSERRATTRTDGHRDTSRSSATPSRITTLRRQEHHMKPRTLVRAGAAVAVGILVLGRRRRRLRLLQCQRSRHGDGERGLGSGRHPADHQHRPVDPAHPVGRKPALRRIHPQQQPDRCRGRDRLDVREPATWAPATRPHPPGRTSSAAAPAGSRSARRWWSTTRWPPARQSPRKASAWCFRPCRWFRRDPSRTPARAPRSASPSPATASSSHRGHRHLRLWEPSEPGRQSRPIRRPRPLHRPNRMRNHHGRI